MSDEKTSEQIASEKSAETVKFWKTEMELAGKVAGLDQFIKRGEKIVKRYRDERNKDATYDDQVNPGGAKFNILWSNVQTMKPAIYAKAPKPVVERRYMDSDPVGRVASMILERGLSYEVEEAGFHDSMEQAVLDRLLPGRGTLWVRYQPTFKDMPPKTQADAETTEGSEVVSEEPGEAAEIEGTSASPETPQQEVAYECLGVDYVDWKDFLTSPARVWKEVRWVRKRVYMTRKELVDRQFKKAEDIKLDWTPEEMKGSGTTDPQEQEQFQKATVFEIWNKVDRKVIWIAKECDWVLDEKDDPLKLKDFFPTPRPLYATTTNDSLIPVADYYEYQDQAREMDELTARIQALVKAVKAVGTYDASVPEIRRIFEEGVENTLIPVANWAAFSEKGGIDGGISWVPLKDIMEALDKLYIAREATKQSLYEITGISDIIRGQSGAGDKTATEQRIKGQFASLRLNSLQSEVTRYACDVMKIMGEIIAEHFSPMTLFLISGYEQYAAEQIKSAPPPQNPMMGHNGGPPMAPGAPPQSVPADGAVPMGASPPLAPQPPMMPMVPPPPTPEQEQAALFQKAVELLRNDKLRGFRIDIETDSMIEPDADAAKQAATELITAVLQGLEAAGPIIQMAPELARVIGDLLLFAFRRFRVGRSMESALEQAVDELVKRTKNPGPQPPTPEEIKAKAEIEKAAMAKQQAEADFAMDQQRGAVELDAIRQKNAMEMERMQGELQIEREKLNLERERMAMEQQRAGMENAAKEREMSLTAAATEHKAAVETEATERQAELSAEGDQRKHDLAIETAEAKAAQAKKAKPAGEG